MGANDGQGGNGTLLGGGGGITGGGTGGGLQAVPVPGIIAATAGTAGSNGSAYIEW